MVAMSKVGDGSGTPTTFAQTDLFGTWLVYLQRVDSKFAGSTTQIGQTTFSPSGTFSTGALVDASAPPITTTLTTGNVVIGTTNGSVTGFLAAGTTATAPRYTITGTMRAAKDLITGVLTANVSAKVSYGLVTLVRDVSFFDLSQPTFNVTEGNPITVTVKRTGNTTAQIGRASCRERV